MKKTSVYVFVIVGCVLVAVILVLAAVALWMEKKTGYTPAGSAAAPASVAQEKAVSAAVQTPAVVVEQEVSEPGQSPQEDQEQQGAEYDGVMHGPMTM
jgi:flagellar basal body-associated protein FliL